MTEILSQEEIDALLDAISSMVPHREIKNIKDFGNYLVQNIEDNDKNSFANQNVNIFQGPHVTVSKRLINDIYTQAVVKEPKATIKIGRAHV